jgi:hypothetical protein
MTTCLSARDQPAQYRKHGACPQLRAEGPGRSTTVPCLRGNSVAPPSLSALGPDRRTTRTATVPALNGLAHELLRVADQLLKWVELLSTAACLDFVLALFTLCLGAAILLGSPELSGGMAFYPQLARLIALYLVLFQGLPVTPVWRRLWARS